MRTLLLPIAVILFLITRSAKQLYDNVTYRFVGLKIYKNESNLFGTYLTTKLLVTNPTNAQMTFNQVQGSAKYNGEPVGQFQVDGPATIEPQQTLTVNVKITAFNITLFKNIILSILNNQRPDILLVGKIDTSLGNIPFEEAITWS